LEAHEKDKILTLLQWLTPIIIIVITGFFLGKSYELQSFDLIKALVLAGSSISAISFHMDLPKECTRKNLHQTTKACLGMLGMFMLSFASMFSLYN
jgi:hypothetical protein